MLCRGFGEGTRVGVGDGGYVRTEERSKGKLIYTAPESAIMFLKNELLGKCSQTLSANITKRLRTQAEYQVTAVEDDKMQELWIYAGYPATAAMNSRFTSHIAIVFME